MRFKAIGSAGLQSALTLDAVKAWERGNQREVLVQTEAGKVTIAAVAEDSTLWLLLCALCLCGFLVLAGGGVLFLMLRKRAAPTPAAPPPPATPSNGARPAALPSPRAAPPPQPIGSLQCRHCGHPQPIGRQVL